MSIPLIYHETKIVGSRGVTSIRGLRVAPVPHLPAALEISNADIGAALNFVGFGITEQGDSGAKLQADRPLAALGCGVYGCPDNGDRATQVSYTQTGTQGGPCSGDSGGPFFVARNGSAYVGGVTSYGDSYCTLYGVSTRADAFETFINDFIGVAAPPPPDCSADGTCNPDCGDDPDCAGPPPPADCGNGVCDADESCDGRDGTAACASDCPGQIAGKPAKRYCYVGDACVGSGCR